MPTPSSTLLTTKLASLAAVLAVVVGALVLAGWAFDIAMLKSIRPGWVAMKANTAVCFILIGVALLLVTRPPAIFNPERSGRSFSYGNRTVYPLRVQFSTFISRFARICGLLAGLIGLLTLGEYIFGWNPGIDQWLFIEPSGALGTSHPGRMAPVAALCFVLLAAALWFTDGFRKTRRTMLTQAILGLLVTIIALAAILSYLPPSLSEYGWFGLTIMAMHTALLFAMLGMAVIAICWRQDVLQWSLGRNTTTAFVCGMAVLMLISLSINRSQFWLGEINRKIAYSVEAQDYIESLVIEVIDAQAHTRGYIITGDELFKARYLEASANSNVKLDALRKLTAGNPHRRQQLARLEAQAKAQLQWFQQVIDARQTSMADAARNNMIRHGEGLLDNFRITYDQVKNEHQQFIKELKQESKSVARFSYITITTGTLASLLIFLVVIFRLNSAVNESKQAENAQRESEAGIRALVEHSPIAMIVNVGVDEGEKVIMMNRQFTNLFGYTMADVPDARHWLLLAHPDEKYREALTTEWAGRVEKAIHSHGDIEPMEVTVTCKDGSSRHVRISLASAGSRNIVTFEDLTERKQAEELLKNMATKYRAMFDSSSDAIMLLDEKVFFDCNPATLRIFGSQSRDDFINKHPAQISPPTQPGGKDSTSLANQHIAAAFKIGSILFEWTHRRLDGTEFPAEVLLTAMELDGKPVLQATVRDITERNQTKSRLAEQFEELRRWHDATLGREMRTLELKHEVNELLGKAGQPPRYPSAEPDDREGSDV